MSTPALRRALVTTIVAALALALAGVAGATNYVVLYKAQGVSAGGGEAVRAAGGTVVASYPQIGVVIAESSSPGFRAAMLEAAGVQEVAGSDSPVARVSPVEDSSHDPELELPNAPAGQDTLAPLQWDMRQIQAPEANAVTGGSPAVVVGDIDTGLDKDHPDLVENIDFEHSVSCESGAPVNDPAAWDDRHGHGTHTAGTIAAADNGFGIVGVAPNVKVAGIKSSNDDGYFFAHMVVCSFMWAGSQHLDVTNNSYFMDPFLYNCRNDEEQRTLWKAAQRAVSYAHAQGVTNVASLGNDNDDRAHPAYDVISPDFPPGSEEEREITNACVVVPVEVPGVIGISATGDLNQKSFYSSYGVGVTEVAAPGGDSVLQRTAEAPNGRVLSTWPADSFCRPDRTVVDPNEPTAVYCYAQGTSMAAPHAAGVAALIISRYGDAQNPQNGKMRPGAVESHLQATADPIRCPTDEEYAAYAPFPRPAPHDQEGEPQRCQGGPSYNSWYGKGQVNALDAVLHDTRHDSIEPGSPTP